MHLVIEFIQNGNGEFKFRLVYFATDEDTGACFVYDIAEHDAASTNPADFALSHVGWYNLASIEVLCDLDSISYTRADTRIMLELTKVEDSQPSYALLRRLNMALSVCKLHALGYVDDHGRIAPPSEAIYCKGADNILQAYFDSNQNEDGDFLPYVEPANRC